MRPPFYSTFHRATLGHERCLELGGSSQGWLGTETSTHPSHVDEWVWGLKGGDEV